MKKRCFALLLVLVMLSTQALADTLSFTGSVTASSAVQVYAPIGGTVDAVYAEAGSSVTADSVLATLRTNKVYAAEDGTVTAVFGQPGDSADTVSARYGALIYLEGDVRYTVSASTANAYNETENQFIHVGESVWLQSRTKSSHVGTGQVTSVSGTSYTVDVLTGDFLLDESVEIFRSSAYTASARIGRGSIARKAPSTVTASGSIVSCAVSAGDTVKRGDLLLETLDGTFDGLYMSGTDLYADTEGTVGKINLTEGSAVQKGSIMAVIYPKNAMRVEISVNEIDLGYVRVGDPVVVELTWNQDEGVAYDGRISAISAIGEASGDSVTYPVYVDFTPDENTRYGMSAIVTTVDPDEDIAEPAEEEPAEEKPAEEAAPAEGFDGRFPEGFDGQFPEGFDGQFPEGFEGQFPEGFGGQRPEGFGGSRGGNGQ